jgi:hypothetical protein
MTYDKAKCTGKKMLTFYYLAVHVAEPFQVYASCVRLQGGGAAGGGGGAAGGDAKNATAPASAPKPARGAAPKPASGARAAAPASDNGARKCKRLL